MPEHIGKEIASDLESQEPGAKAENLEKKTTEGIEYPRGARLIAILACLYLAIFLSSLDRTIVATAVPSITNEFNSITDIGWYSSAFTLTFCTFQLIFGRIYTFYPPKWVFIGSIGLFEVGSIVCASAPSSIAFIIGRAIAGLGGSGMLGGAVVTLINSVPLHKRPKYQGFLGLVFGVAAVAGPLIGGAFTTKYSWRWCFWINVPIGVLAMVLLGFFLHIPESASNQRDLPFKKKLLRLDPLGTSIFLPGVVCLLLALQWGGTTYAWSSARVIVLLTLGIALVLTFVILQFFLGDNATIPVRVLLHRSILAGVLFTFCSYSVLMIFVYYLSIWFQAIKGATAVKSGIMSLPLLISLIIGSIGAGQLVSRFGYYTPFMLISTVLISIGAGLFTTFTPTTGHAMWIGYQVLVGIGLGLGQQQPSIAAQTVLERKDVPTGISLMFFAQNFGGAIFVSVAQNILDSRLVSGLRNVPGLNVNLLDVGATELRGTVPPQALLTVLKAYNGAIVQAFWITVGLACMTAIGALCMEWKSVKKGKKSG